MVTHLKYPLARVRLFFIMVLFYVIRPGVSAQLNWLNYFDLVNQAEEEFVVNNNARRSCQLYDSAFTVYNRPFVSDVYIAAEIAYYNADTSRFIRYISTCFNRGMTFQCLQRAPLFSSVFTNPRLLGQLQQLYNNRTLPDLDMALHDTVYFHMYREQMIKKNLGRDREKFVDMHKMVKLNVAFFNTFLDKGTFPTEQMIGLFSEDDKEAFFKKYNLESYEPTLPKNLTNGNTQITVGNLIPADYDLSNSSALFSYLHYPCGFELNKEKFWNAVINGYIHAKDYCMMEEWFAKSMGNPNYEHDCTETRNSAYYNIIYEMQVTDPGLIIQVEKNRAEKHIQKYEVDLLKRKLKKEKGFEFFFGFLYFR